MASVKLTDVKKIYDNKVTAVHDFNLEIKDKEFVVFVGPSGCGKSTTLRMIAGLEDISGGTLEIDGEVVNDLQPKDRDIAMVFQNYALYPHMTVYDNIAFSLRLKKIILPLSKPIVIYTVLTAFMGPWGDFVFARYISFGASAGMNVAVGLYNWLTPDQINNNYTMFCAGGVLVAIPVTLLFLFLQKYYVEGVTGGAVKG